ncbi:protein NDNF [Narcine bancroftii]|uniref:protein NDNF n=1 Tax=Narcine bancroftii TaxID=1343680 RepID=UPI0038320E21
MPMVTSRMMLITTWSMTLLLLLATKSRTQKLPTRDEELFQMQLRDNSLFHDSAIIPDGAEISSFLFRDAPKRYYFVVEEDNTPMSITITPCDAPLEWKLTLQDLPEESSGEGSGEPEPLELQKQRQVLNELVTDLYSYKGNDVESYQASNSPSGLYRLELISTEKDTNFKVYATTTPDSDQPYPELPYDPRVDVTSLGRTTVTLAWKPSPTVSQLRQPIQYCVIINQEHNFKSLCAAEAKLNADDAFMAAPKPGLDFSPFDFAYFGFSSDSGRKRERRIMAKPLTTRMSRRVTGARKVDLQQICIGNKNIFTVSDLKPDTQYYFDIFAVNANSNMSTAYVGTFAKTKEELKQKTMELKDGKVTDVFIKRKGVKFLRFVPVSSHQKVILYVHSCLDAVQIQVRRDGKLQLSQNMEGVRLFQLRGKPKAKYLIRLKGNRRGASLLKILATNRPNKQPFPSVPEDTRIKVFDKLRTCSSVTVAWLGTQDRNKFCVYKKLVESNYSEEQKKREQNQCIGPDARKKSEKVVCKYFHSHILQKAVTTETIRGLQPGKSYLLDVYVIGHGGHSVKYQSKLVKTRRSC